jgi:hypothetical protein
MKKSDLLTLDNIEELGFEYNHFEGYIYQTKDGFSVNHLCINRIRYRDKWHDCKTVGDFLELRSRKAELDKIPLNFDGYNTSKEYIIEL